MRITVWHDYREEPDIDIKVTYTEKYLKLNWDNIADGIASFIDFDLKARVIHLDCMSDERPCYTRFIVKCNRHPAISCAIYGRIAERIGIQVPKIEDMEETK